MRKLKQLFSLLVFLLLARCDAALAVPPSSSSAGVTQSGAVTSGHCAQWSGVGQISDSGAACGGGGGSGTVTSVGLTDNSGFFTITGSPVTTSGNIGIAFASETANLVFAAPNGSSGAPTFRSLVGADLPTPGASSLGGVQSFAAVSHQFLKSISTLGVVAAAQPVCADISDAGTVCTQNTGTSGATVPLLNGSNTASGNDIFSGTLAVTATATPTQAAGTLGLAGTATKPTLAANSEGDVFLTAADGFNIIGQGSTNDFRLWNKSGTSVCTVATGTTNFNCTGLQVGGTNVLTANQTITLSGDTTGSGTTAITTSTSKVNGGSIPASAHVVGTNVSSQFVSAAASDIVALFSTCSGSQYLGADGSCHTASGAGTVTSITCSTGLTCTSVNPITSSGTITASNNNIARQVTFTLDGSGSAITSGGTWYLASVPYSGTITSWNLVADQSGSIVIDVWKANAAVPTVANTITASALPTLSSAQSAFSGAITGWTTSVTAGDVFAFHVNSASTVQKISLTILINAS